MAATEYQYLEVDTRDAVGWIVQDRPERHNAMVLEMARELADAVDAHASNDAVRAIVLTGTGPAFNTGADLSAFEGSPADQDDLWTIANTLHVAVNGIVTAPKPVVVGINGTVAGGGLGLALAGDIVLMAAHARLEFAYPRVGLCGDGGSTMLVPALIGYRRAREFCLLDDAIDADEAAEMGLVTRVVDGDRLEAELTAVAERLASGPTKAYATTKRLLNQGRTRSFEEHLDAEAEAIAALTDTADYARGHAAFLEKEEPSFVGR